MSKRLKLTFAPGEWRKVKALLKREYPYLPPTTSAKFILLQLSETKGPIEPKVTRSHPESPGVTQGQIGPINSHVSSDMNQGPPDLIPLPIVPPSPARAPVREKEKEKEDKNKRGSVEGGKKKREIRLAPLDIATRIVEDLNTQAGTAYRPKGKRVRELIQLRLAEGYTEADFLEVNRKKAKEWKSTEMAKYLTYETLYSRKFEKYLGQPDLEPNGKPSNCKPKAPRTGVYLDGEGWHHYDKNGRLVPSDGV